MATNTANKADDLSDKSQSAAISTPSHAANAGDNGTHHGTTRSSENTDEGMLDVICSVVPCRIHSFFCRCGESFK